MSSLPAAIAAHRFGLGEPDLGVVGADAQGWLLAQIGAADPQRGTGLPSAADGLRAHDAYLRTLRQMRADGDAMTSKPIEQQFVEHFRELVQADIAARLSTAATTQRPFTERLALFWSNHFTVSIAKGASRGLAGAFEREAIRPHIAGNFEQLLGASTRHAAMLRYLDNALSAGPHSRAVERLARVQQRDGVVPRITGLNENLAREVLELHTLGVDGGYTQADVTAFAAVLTGWRAPRLPRGDEASFFDAAWHEPGAKTVLGKRYAEGPQALADVLHDLTRHPATARFIATKLARHFVADDPPPVLVDRLAKAFSDSGGDLPTVYRELVRAPEGWQASATKLKTPEELVVSSARVLRVGEAMVARGRDGGVTLMGQRVQAAPSPAGWPDRAEEWLGPEAVWKRLEWATRVGDRLGRQLDARTLAGRALGPALSDNARLQIERAADGPQALALLLMAPEFQRR
ncbi:MAG TPA: DUF1800 domain-containing protein [Burkholderiaceae bacterium]|nr:DUF1800 domain-containing protein [Burkholderiaceae bacterium]